jgi:hypothetical protein
MNRFAQAPDRVAGSPGGPKWSTRSGDPLVTDNERHLTAVARSVGWARESAARGDYVDALGWIEVIEAIGDKLSDDCQIERQAWRTALAVHER